MKSVKKKYRISRYMYKSWAISEWREKEERWVPMLYPGDLKHAVAGLIDLHIGPNYEVNFELTYPQVLVRDTRHQAPVVNLNVDVDELRRLETAIEKSTQYVLDNIKDLVEV